MRKGKAGIPTDILRGEKTDIAEENERRGAMRVAAMNKKAKEKRMKMGLGGAGEGGRFWDPPPKN